MSEISRTVSTALQSLRQREHTVRLAEQISDASREVTTGLKANPYEVLGHRSADAISVRMQIVRNDGFLVSNSLLERRFLGIENALGSVREAGMDVIDASLLAQSSSGQSAGYLSQIARSALDTMIERTAVSDTSGFLMSGTRNNAKPLQDWEVPNADTGLTPQSIVTTAIGGPLTSVADVNAAVARLETIFADGDVATPDNNFEASFYNGTPRLDGAGQPNDPMTMRISETESMAQPAQANVAAMRDLMRGLAMLSEVDVNAITDDAARDAWLSEARAAISNGVDGIAAMEVDTGLRRGRLADTIAAQEAKANFLAGEQLLLEGADEYDAATRLMQLQTQLDSSYAVTARLSRLSFLNYI